MKKSELKNIIKECVKEVIFEEGVLSGIITEVAQGLTGASIIQESSYPRQGSAPAEVKQQMRKAMQTKPHNYEDAKRKFQNPALFEGTRPVPGDKGQGALSGQDPKDPGVDISNIPGLQHWGTLAHAKNQY
jgi:hypothetical protein